MRGMLPEVRRRIKLGTLDRLGSDPVAARRFILRSFGGEHGVSRGTVRRALDIFGIKGWS
jgi:hypothetical protein